MTDLLDRAVARLRALPAEAQDEAAQLLLDWANDLSRQIDDRRAEEIDPVDSAAVAEGLADVRAGRLASDADVEAAYASFKSPR